MKTPHATAALAILAVLSAAMLRSAPAAADDCQKGVWGPASRASKSEAISACFAYMQANHDPRGTLVPDGANCQATQLGWDCYCYSVLCMPQKKADPKLDPSAPFPRSALPPGKLAPASVASKSGPCPAGKHLTSGHCCPNGTSWNPALRHCH